jgi:DNA-binding CsgD family transcriptional regulator
LREEGEASGINRIYRIYREEGLTVRKRRARRRRSEPGRPWVERRQNRIGSARRFLAEALEACDARKCLAPVLEERPLVIALLDDPRMAGSALAGVPVPRQLRRGVGNRSQSKAADLTRQELRALLLLVEGCSNKEIAHQMGVSLPTAKFHLKNLYRKLGAEDRRTAVHVARNRALVET